LTRKPLDQPSRDPERRKNHRVHVDRRTSKGYHWEKKTTQKEKTDKPD